MCPGDGCKGCAGCTGVKGVPGERLAHALHIRDAVHSASEQHGDTGNQRKVCTGDGCKGCAGCVGERLAQQRDLGARNLLGERLAHPGGKGDLPTETNVESGTSQSKSGTSVNLSNSEDPGEVVCEGGLHISEARDAGAAPGVGPLGVHPAEHDAGCERSEGERLTGWERSEASVSEAALLTWGPPMGRFFALFCLQVLLLYSRYRS